MCIRDRSARAEVSGPRSRHFWFAIIVPIFTSPAPGMVRDLSHRNRGVAVAAKPGRHVAGANRFVITLAEQCSIISWSVSTSEQGVAGGSAGGGLNVVPGDGTALPGEGINIGGVDIPGAEAFELRAEVIDTDEKDVGPPGGRNQGHCEKKSEQAMAAEERKRPPFQVRVKIGSVHRTEA